VGFEPKISAGERPQTYALDRAATGIDVSRTLQFKITDKMMVQNIAVTRIG